MKRSGENYNKEVPKEVKSDGIPFKESVVFQEWGRERNG